MTNSDSFWMLEFLINWSLISGEKLKTKIKSTGELDEII